jgi:hypothetical protein
MLEWKNVVPTVQSRADQKPVHYLNLACLARQGVWHRVPLFFLAAPPAMHGGRGDQDRVSEALPNMRSLWRLIAGDADQSLRLP